jgi:hypothetical protein
MSAYNSMEGPPPSPRATSVLEIGKGPNTAVTCYHYSMLCCHMRAEADPPRRRGSCDKVVGDKRTAKLATKFSTRRHEPGFCPLKGT